MIRFLTAIVVAAVAASTTAAAVIGVTPANYTAALAAAAPGDTLAATAGSYPAAVVSHKTFSPPVTLSAPEAAVFNTLTLDTVDGFNVVGGTFTAPPPGIYSLAVTHSSNVVLDRVLMTGSRTGLLAAFDTNLTVTNWEVSAMQQDGIDLVASQNVKIIGGVCQGFVPRAGAHPDCLQMRSDAGTVALSNIEVANNWCVGPPACINTFGNKMQTVNLNIHDNRARIRESAAVDTRTGGNVGCTVNNNIGELIRGSSAIVNVVLGSGCTGSGNARSLRPVALPQ